MPRDTVSACSTPRGTSARCTERGSVQRLAHFNVIRTRVVLSVIPVSAFATRRGTKARCAEVVPVSVIPPSAVARVDGA